MDGNGDGSIISTDSPYWETCGSQRKKSAWRKKKKRMERIEMGIKEERIHAGHDRNSNLSKCHLGNTVCCAL